MGKLNIIVFENNGVVGKIATPLFFRISLKSFANPLRMPYNKGCYEKFE